MKKIGKKFQQKKGGHEGAPRIGGKTNDTKKSSAHVLGVRSRRKKDIFGGKAYGELRKGKGKIKTQRRTAKAPGKGKKRCWELP